MERAELQRREQHLRDSPHRVHDARLDAYLQRLLGRLDPQTPALRIHILDRPEPQAELLGGEALVLRTGLFARTRDEDELAFVLAHELAHRTLAHVAARRRNDWDARAAELAADRAAASTSQRLGYRASAGPGLLRRLLASTRHEGAREMIEARIDALSGADSQAPASTDREFDAVMARYRGAERAGGG
jgi:beta-barrel assembly-enhancing protease